jgi:hypothetical protein
VFRTVLVWQQDILATLITEIEADTGFPEDRQGIVLSYLNHDIIVKTDCEAKANSRTI